MSKTFLVFPGKGGVILRPIFPIHRYIHQGTGHAKSSPLTLGNLLGTQKDVLGARRVIAPHKIIIPVLQSINDGNNPLAPVKYEMRGGILLRNEVEKEKTTRFLDIT